MTKFLKAKGRRRDGKEEIQANDQAGKGRDETDPEGAERERRDPAGQETPEPQGLHREYPKQVE